MQSREHKVDMAALNSAIDKALAYQPLPKAEQKKKRTQSKAGSPSLSENLRLRSRPISGGPNSDHADHDDHDDIIAPRPRYRRARVSKNLAAVMYRMSTREG